MKTLLRVLSIARRVSSRSLLAILVAIPLAALVGIQLLAYTRMPPPVCTELDPAVSRAACAAKIESQGVHRCDFPSGFVFGTATSAYQVEGAVKEGGRSPSIWDTFCHTEGKILDGTNGDIAIDQYHRYKEDVDIMADMGVDAYRFSVAWSRIYPDGLESGVNSEGIAYYNRLIDYLLEKGIQPYITLFHWDLPQNLQDSFGGWTSKEIVKHFGAYAETCFGAFGDRVKNWITLNEPLQFCVQGYGTGIHAPGRTSDRSWSSEGNSSTEPYLAAHNAILSHATAVKIYKEKFQSKQRGEIGITVDVEWAEPMTDSEQDKIAAQRRLEFQVGWFLDPLWFGEYPFVMRQHVSDRLPEFTPDEKALLASGKGDFVGLNHYTSRYVTSANYPHNSKNYYQDQRVMAQAVRNGVVIGDRAASEWLYIVPWGLCKLLKFVSEKYGRPPIYVTENGMDDEELLMKNLSMEERVNDTKRVDYYQQYLSSVLKASREGVDVRGYFAWSLADNFEWAMGYTKRFGLIYVDFDTLKRHRKLSASWYKTFLTK